VKTHAESFGIAAPKTPDSPAKEERKEQQTEGFLEFGINKIFESVNKLRKRTLMIDIETIEMAKKVDVVKQDENENNEQSN